MSSLFLLGQFERQRRGGRYPRFRDPGCRFPFDSSTTHELVKVLDVALRPGCRRCFPGPGRAMQLAQSCVPGFNRECFGIEAPAPREHILVFFVFRIRERLEVKCIARRPAGIFRRSILSASDAPRVDDVRFGQQDRIEENDVPPVVAKSYTYSNVSPTRLKIRFRDTKSLVHHLAFVKCVVRVGNTINLPAHSELVQAVVLPIEKRLKNPVQLRQFGVFRNLNRAPDGRIDIA